MGASVGNAWMIASGDNARMMLIELECSDGVDNAQMTLVISLAVLVGNMVMPG